MKAELTNSGSEKHTHRQFDFFPFASERLCMSAYVNMWVDACVSLCERLTAQPVDGSLSPDALLLRARCPGDVEQRSQEVTGGCCV